MRTLERRKQTIGILAPTITTGAMGSKIITWTGTATSVKAAVQPISAQVDITEYGTRVDRMMLVIVPKATVCEIGYGVWLAGESSSLPPWKIVSKAQWNDLTNLTIEKSA